MCDSSSDSSVEEIVIRRQRIFKQRICYSYMTCSYEFNERFRLTHEKFNLLLNMLSPLLHRQTLRNKSLSVETLLLVALHWLGNGGQYHGICDMHGISKASVCRVIKEVVTAVNTTMFNAYVNWPDNMDKFFEIKGLSSVCVCVDGTLIKIDAPKSHEAAYVDRHGDHSISCMVVCGPDLTFYYSYANWPGSTHDARVMRNSSLFERMESGWRPIGNGIILGDSTYPLKDFLIPPIATPSPNNLRFLRAHKSTRRVIENAIGIFEGIISMFKPLEVNQEYACDIFNCCVTLCNFARGEEEIQIDDNEDENYEPNDNQDNLEEDNASDQGGRNRLEIILNSFSS